MALRMLCWWLLGALLAWELDASVACNFPNFTQSNGTAGGRDWRSRIKEQNTEFTLQIEIHQNVMKTVSMDPNVASHTRVCVQSLGETKFLVVHEEPDQSGSRYMCLEFVKRSDNVMQTRVSKISARMEQSLCEPDQLSLDDWLIVDKKHIEDDRQQCALKGGFSIRIFDKFYNEAKCDAYAGETRLESECLEGEGLTFFFREQRCLPSHLYMYATQRTVCVANWQEGPYTFSLLKHESMQYMWVLRIPTSVRESFVAYVFYDIVAYTEALVTKSEAYMRLDTVRDIPIPITSLCVDDYEICGFRTGPCDMNSKSTLYCPRTCKLCSSTRPAQCSFDNRFHGQWYNAASPGTLAVTVNHTFLTTYTSEGTQEQFHCMQWDPPVPADAKEDRYSSTKMVVSEFTNGCKPRYTCVSLLQKAGSLLFLKLSQGQSWPFTENANQPADCSRFSYENDHTLAPNLFKSANFKLVYARTSNSVPCNLPDSLTNFHAEFKGSANCSASLVAGSRVNAFHVEVNCSKHILDTSYTCIESSRMLPSNPLLIVTRSGSNPDQILCWVFPRRTARSAFYLLEPSQCNEGVRRRIRRNRIRALVTFSKPGKVKEPKDGLSRPSSPVSTRSPAVRATEKKAETGRNEDPLYPATSTVNTTDGVDESDVNATPFVVVAAVLFFIVFQIPCTCRS